MSYLDDIGKELSQLLIKTYGTPMAGPELDIIGFVREKLLESYRNGAQAARKQMDKAQPPKPKQKSPAADDRKA